MSAQTRLGIAEMESFSNIISQNFLAPKNVGSLGPQAFSGCGGSFICGGAVRVWLNIDDEQRIIDAKFKAAGCSCLVGSASYLTEEIKGELSGEVAALLQAPAGTVRQALGEIPEEKGHCVSLLCEALLAAITAHSDAVRHEWHGDEALICSCFCVSESTIAHLISTKGLKTISDVTRACNAGGGCRSCYSLIEDLLAEYAGV
jgi:NifU-like protein